MAYRWAPGTVADVGYQGDPGRDIAAAFAANAARKKAPKKKDEEEEVEKKGGSQPSAGSKRPTAPRKGSRY